MTRIGLLGCGNIERIIAAVHDSHPDRARTVADLCGAVSATGVFGRLTLRLDNVPCPDNPRTSDLAALSVLALLERLDAPLAVGT